MKIDFDSTDSSERRLILVAGDRRYQELCEQVDWKKVLTGLGIFLPFAGFGHVLLPAFGMSTYFRSTIAAASTGLTGKLKSLFRKGEIPLPHLSPAEALRRFTFDVGEPVEGRVYVINPCLPDTYVLAAVAEERLAQEKVSAFMQLCSGLGARKVMVSSKSEASDKADVSFKEFSTSIGLGMAWESTDQRERAVVAEYGPPREPPKIPEAAAPWVLQDPILRAFAATRLEGNVLSAQAAITIGQDSGLDAKLAAELEGLHISLGGGYKTTQKGSFSFKVDFWPAGEQAA